jgi:ATP-dependent Clp protease protease subunit
VASQLLALAGDSEADITVFINSQGGHAEAGDTIHDLVRFIRPKVRMIGTGWVASAGPLIFVAVPKTQRYCLPNTRFLLHQPAGGAGGSASDIEIEAREILQMRDRVNRILARETGQPLERIEEDTHRNFWLSAEAAVRYGLVGRIISHVSEVDE